jgi:hypothetical protein
MDFNKVSEHGILYAITAIVAVIVAIAVRYACIAGGVDLGTANLVFVVVLAVEAVSYLLLAKSIIRLVDNLLARRIKSRAGKTAAATSAEESPYDRIVREKFEGKIADFRKYTAIVLRSHVSAEELQRLDGYIDIYAREQPLDKPERIKIHSHKISNNDLYHYGRNLWNHFRADRKDKRQECVVDWLKAVFANLENVEPSTIKGKLTIFDPNGHIPVIENISDFLRSLNEKP